ncbi:hypothetical protein Golob_004294 [Gossypium lobatum]|uniref:Uncharacterized protein n=1 Tax=Gossypium lobatum TaxID=34289 RepID=A0A7J8N184_9ROSI|nr:hypothetical protein [Gossypium lobatum]
MGLQMLVIEGDALTVIHKLQKDHTDRSEMGFSYPTADLLVQASKRASFNEHSAKPT